MEAQEPLNDNEVDSLQPETIGAPTVPEAMANAQEAPEVDADQVMVEQPAEETVEPVATENGSEEGKKKRPSPKKLSEAKKGPKKKSEKPEQKAKVE